MAENDDKVAPAPVHTGQDYSKVVQEKDVDVAFGLATELDHEHYQLTPEMDRKVRRKIDFILLPLMSITATLSFLDKVSNNYANAAGLTKDLHLKGDEYSWTSSIFYFAFLIWQPVMSYFTQKLPIGKVVAVNCVCWGVMILAQGFVRSFSPFMALRFFQGIFEAALLPSFLLMSSQWWKRSEQSLRAAFWFNSVAGILGGLFAYAIEHIHGALPFIWQYIYVIYGAVSIGWGFIILFLLPDSPVNAWFLKPHERLAAVARVKENKTGIQAKHFKTEQLKEALLDPKTWFFFLFTYVCNVPNGGLNAFSTTIVKGFGFDTLHTDLLQVPFGVIGTLGNIVIGLALSYTHSKRLYLIAFIALIPLIGEVVQYTVPSSNRGVSLMGYYFTGCFNSAYVMMLSLAASNTAGHTKKVVTNGIIWVGYCVGNISGPFFFKSSEAPHYRGGVAALLVCFCLQVSGALGFRVYLRYLNAQRDQLQLQTGEEYDESAEAAFLDRTDKENTSFRYTY